MPITGPSSYPATINAFLAHWGEVNDALGANPLILPDGSAMAALVALQETIETTRSDVTTRGVDRDVARSVLTAQITTLQARLVAFNARLRTNFAGPLADALPVAFGVGAGEAIVREALRRMSRLWARANATTPAPPGLTLPLTLEGGAGSADDFTLAMLDAASDALRQAYRDLSAAEVDVDVARSERNVAQEKVYAILKAYRAKVTSDLRAYPALVETLPRLSPEPGKTPAPVAAKVAWVAATEQAKITWVASPEAALARYEVRGAAGDDYNADDETVLATIAPEQPREFLTDFALPAPGATAGYKVYVILDTDNEKGSDAVYVTRP